MIVRSAALSNRGRVRTGNEDSHLADDILGLFLVADGMGGGLAGEVASSTAAESVREFLTQSASASVARGGQPSLNASRLAQALAYANQVVHDASRNREDWRGMGTTLAATLLEGRRLTVTHAGDSRVYLVRGQTLTRLTEDHSLVMDQVRQGLVEPEQAACSARRHVITRALGPFPRVEAETAEMDLMDGDRLLLCTDGLTDTVSDDEILALVTDAVNPVLACERLVSLANERGGQDNITAVVVFLADEGYLLRFLRRMRG